MKWLEVKMNMGRDDYGLHGPFDGRIGLSPIKKNRQVASGMGSPPPLQIISIYNRLTMKKLTTTSRLWSLL